MARSIFPWLENKVICVDPGHGGKDTGGVGVTGTLEKTVVLDVAFKLATLLLRAGARVVMTRQDDNFVRLADRAAIANRINADIFVSIHSNIARRPDISGLGVFYWHENPEGRRLAERIFEQVQFLTGLETWGDGLWPCVPGTWTNFYVMRATKMTAVLAEIGFLSNKADEALLREESFRNLKIFNLFQFKKIFSVKCVKVLSVEN